MKIGVAGPIDVHLLKDLFPPSQDVPETYRFALIANLARALHDRGHDITVFALSREVPVVRQIEGERITAYICPQRRPRWQMVDFFRRERQVLRDAMRAARCDVIHAHWTYEFAAAALDSGLPCVITAHDIPTVVLRFARHPYWLEKPLLALPVLRAAKHLTAVSPYVADALRPFVGRHCQIAVVPNGTTVGRAAHCRDRQDVARGVEPMRFASVLTGWSALKNGSRLIEAFAMLRKALGTSVQLVMFGEGHQDGGPAYEWARRRRLADGISFAGPLPYTALIASLATAVDVLVHPSLTESFGMAVLEAMALGIPVIGGAASGAVPWVLGAGSAGLLVDVTSPNSIAAGMFTLVTDRARRRALAEAGRHRALTNFQIQHVARQYEAILDAARQEQAP